MDLKTGLIRITNALNVSFTLNGQSLKNDEVFSEIGFLPAFAKRADQLCSLCLGYGLGVTFPEAEDTRLGIKTVFDDETPMALRYLCILDVLHDMIRTSPSNTHIPLDDLVE